MKWTQIVAIICLLPQVVHAEGAPAPAKKAKSANAKSAERELGLLAITTPERGLEIQLNGQKMGTSPLPGPWTVAPGEYVVKFIRAGKSVGEVKTRIVEGESKSVIWPEPSTQVTEQSRWKWAPWSLSDVGVAVTAGGLVAVGVGAYFGVRAVDLGQEAGRMVLSETKRADYDRLTEQSSNAALAANLSYGVGAAAVISGLVMTVFGEGGVMSLSADGEETTVIIDGTF